ncbi:hypothetical protein PTSG_00444 [Salpingoeca rosetta]|uniref:Uncharacterized protein n=1 Tax=Salpingoeca rosetta (strain ATCC 50818 / BSB-021) TaxID=946362 RepID=F2TWH9_SALR5|nr:uncharacterized protein PTSG_00444 [Salpingoeca rosetta]EGD72425.1 hypothetical protein PTSG_00444 [Salpingoeca rosetta]|eukprot:XP_004998994.1 hypothetical protein PTSG_00444 [Salpingoeca rosetta]
MLPGCTSRARSRTPPVAPSNGSLVVWLTLALPLLLVHLIDAQQTPLMKASATTVNNTSYIRDDVVTSTATPNSGGVEAALSLPGIIGIVGAITVVALVVILAFKYASDRQSKRSMSATALTDALIEQYASQGSVKVRADGQESHGVLQKQRQATAANNIMPNGSLYTARAPRMPCDEAILAPLAEDPAMSWDGGDTVISVKDGIYCNIRGKRQTMDPPSEASTSSVVTDTSSTVLDDDNGDTANQRRKVPEYMPMYARADEESVIGQLDPEVRDILRNGRPPPSSFRLEYA